MVKPIIKDFKIDFLQFSYKNVHIKEIKVTFFDIWKTNRGIADIFESVRKSENKQFNEEEIKEITNFLNRINVKNIGKRPYNAIKFKASVEKINSFTDILIEKILNVIGDEVIFLNECFGKNTNDSITKSELSDELDNNFYFKPELIKQQIDNLIIIDDVINLGRTLNQFLIRLVDYEKITSNTNIYLYTIYSFERNDKTTEDYNKMIFGEDNKKE